MDTTEQDKEPKVSESNVERIVIPFAVGDNVVATVGIFYDGEDYNPPCWLAKEGERLIVREIYPNLIGVSHHNVTDTHFLVEKDEIRKV